MSTSILRSNLDLQGRGLPSNGDVYYRWERKTEWETGTPGFYHLCKAIVLTFVCHKEIFKDFFSNLFSKKQKEIRKTGFLTSGGSQRPNTTRKFSGRLCVWRSQRNTTNTEGCFKERKAGCSRSESAAQRLGRVTPISFRWDGTEWNRWSCTYISVKSCLFSHSHC